MCFKIDYQTETKQGRRRRREEKREKEKRGRGESTVRKIYANEMCERTEIYVRKKCVTYGSLCEAESNRKDKGDLNEGIYIYIYPYIYIYIYICICICICIYIYIYVYICIYIGTYIRTYKFTWSVFLPQKYALIWPQKYVSMLQFIVCLRLCQD